jgi:hypothetical protein
MSGQHTPGPWRLSHELDTHVEAEASGNFVASCDGGGEDGEYETDLANARRIVQCVNAHDELVEVLGRIVRQGETQMNDDRGQRFVEVSKKDIRAARAAIAKATGSAA